MESVWVGKEQKRTGKEKGGTAVSSVEGWDGTEICVWVSVRLYWRVGRKGEDREGVGGRGRGREREE